MAVEQEQDRSVPLVSVVVPTYNRAAALRRCLDALGRQSLPPGDYEAVVVVDGSTDETQAMLAGLRTPYRLRVFLQANSGQPAALNRGAAEAAAPVLLFLDDDFVVGPDLVAEHARLHREQAGVIGIGRMALTAPEGADWFTHFYARDWAAHYQELDADARQPGWEDCYGANMSVEKSAYLAAGGNDAGLKRNYDLDLAYRLQRLGLRFVYLPGAQGWLEEQKRFPALAHDLEQNGFFSVELSRRYPVLMPGLIGFFRSYPLSWQTLWRFLLALGVSPGSLNALGRPFHRLVNLPNWYRFLERYCFWRGVRNGSPNGSFWRDLTAGVPILMYHAFGDDGEPARRFRLPARRFASQMRWLRRWGYHVLSLDEYLQLRRESRLVPARSVVITIDDGYQDTLRLAYPVLRQHHYPAALFVVTGLVGKRYCAPDAPELDGRPMLTWAEIAEMAQEGVSAGAHTRSHPDLTAISPEQAAEEINGSKQDLEAALGLPVRFFSYPFGNVNESVQRLAEAAGYWGSVGVEMGLNTPMTPLHNLRRAEVYGADSLFAFALALLTGERPEIFAHRLKLFAGQAAARLRPHTGRKDQPRPPAPARREEAG